MKEIDINQIIEEVFERSGISSTPKHVHNAIKDIAKLTAKQALDIASEGAGLVGTDKEIVLGIKNRIK